MRARCCAMATKPPTKRGGKIDGAGRKPKLTTSQMQWLKQRYEALMAERAKERALRRDMPSDRIAGDLEELRERQRELRALPIRERKTDYARELQAAAAELINHRVISVGAGRGPMLQHGIKEPSAAQVRELVAREARIKFKRKDITPRLVQTACAMNLSDAEMVARCLSEKG